MKAKIKRNNWPISPITILRKSYTQSQSGQIVFIVIKIWRFGFLQSLWFWFFGNSLVNLVFWGIFLLKSGALGDFLWPKKWRCHLQKCKIWHMVSWGRKKSDSPAQLVKIEKPEPKSCTCTHRIGQLRLLDQYVVLRCFQAVGNRGYFEKRFRQCNQPHRVSM